MTFKADPATRLVLLAITGIWALGWAPNLVTMLQSGRVVNETLSVETRTTSLAHAISAGLVLIVVVTLSMAILVANQRPEVSLLYPAVLLAPWLILYIGHVLLRGGGFTYREVAFPLFVVACYLARPAVVLVCRLLANLTTITAFTALVMAVAMKSIAFMPSWWNSDKAILGESILAGPYDHSNQLGTALALALPFIYLSYGGWAKLLFTGVTSIVLVWSASRTSLIVVAAFLVILAIVKSTKIVLIRAQLLLTAVAIALTTSVALPLMTTDPEAFTRRGLIWQESFRYWLLSPVSGWGPNILSEDNSLTWAIGAHTNSSHNIWLTFATAGGVIAVLAVAAMLFVLIRRASALYKKGETRPLLFLVLLVLIENAEDPIRALHLGPQSYIVWGGIVLAMCSIRENGFEQNGPGRRKEAEPIYLRVPVRLRERS